MGAHVSDVELDCTHITVGTVGEPGDRTFYLQAAEGDRVFTFKIEKEGATALAEHLVDLVDGIAATLGPDPVEPTPDMALRMPIQQDFVVGAIFIDFDDTRGKVAILCSELVLDEEAEPAGAEARLLVSRTRARTLARHAAEIVEAGRPSCELCGFPKGSHHICPRSNGRHE